MGNREKRYTLENINEIELPHEEIKVEDHITGEEKVIKTVSRAEVACKVAYMLGINDDILERYYIHHYEKLLKELRDDKAATIVRILSKVRTIILNNFLVIDQEMTYSLSNLDRMELFDKAELDKLYGWGVYVVQPNYRSDKYIMHITKLLDENIDACSGLFPDSVKFEYIRSLFVIPKYNHMDVLKAEYKKYHANKLRYPFQMYLYWEPADCGYLLYSDSKFLGEIYAQHGEEFYEGYKYHDASDDTKQNIYDFIREAKRVVLAVDCENSDPYKLYAVLKNLEQENVNLIERIYLYDDYHTTIAWDYISELISIPVEHIEVQRVMDEKSLVDMKLAMGVAASFYRDDVDSFILCSSDSDFWGLISSLSEARFLVLYEYMKCGSAIKEKLDSRSIFHCAMDDFYMENARELQNIVLKKVLESYFPSIIGENALEITRRVYADAYIQADDNEIERFYDKYVRHLKLKIGEGGNFEIVCE